MDTEEYTENAGVNTTKDTGVVNNDSDTYRRIEGGNNDTSNYGTNPLTIHENFQEESRVGVRDSASKHKNRPIT